MRGTSGQVSLHGEATPLKTYNFSILSKPPSLAVTHFGGFYSLSQNNIPFQPQDDSVSTGKNSQIKPRKSEQGQGVKITLGEYDKYQ